MRENGLKIVLTHSDWNRILNDTDRLIEEHDILGCDHIGPRRDAGEVPHAGMDPVFCGGL